MVDNISSYKGDIKIWLCLWWIILVAIRETSKYGCVYGIPTLNENNFEPKRKGTLKTIKADGYLIDCVDIYKQPGLDDPSDLQMEPSLQFQSELNKTKNLLFDKINFCQPKPFQNWQKYGKCPKGTIPIRRNWNTNGTIFPNARPTNHEYAQGEQIQGIYHGGGATFNVWNPVVTGDTELSVAQLWVATGSDSHTESIEAGWIVYPYKFRDTRPLFFIFWTADGYQHFCYNLECGDRGFKQTSENTCIGCPIQPSVYGGNMTQITPVIWRDRITGHWWLYVDGNKIGYFPRQLFRNLNQGAERVPFGGEISNNKDGGHHTSTEMGNGRFPREGFRKASFIHSAHVMTPEGEMIDATLTPYASHPRCYNVKIGPSGTSYGTYLFYGGPGYSREQCP